MVQRRRVPIKPCGEPRPFTDGSVGSRLAATKLSEVATDEMKSLTMLIFERHLDEATGDGYRDAWPYVAQLAVLCRGSARRVSPLVPLSIRISRRSMRLVIVAR